MRFFTVIFLIMILVSATASCTGADAIGFGIGLRGVSDLWPFAPSPEPPSWLRYEGPSNGFWFKPDADREQLKQDYGECGVKGEKSCMREKGYTWATF